MDCKNAIKKIKSHREYLMGEQNKGCNYTNLINSLDVAINELQNCNKDRVILIQDGNQWCAYRDGFINLQESNAGFGDSPNDAMANLIRIEYGYFEIRRSVEQGIKQVEKGIKELEEKISYLTKK